MNISCRARGYRTLNNEEMGFISCEYEDGLYAHIEVSWLDWTKRRNLTLVAGGGIASLDCLDQKAHVQQKDKIEQVPIVPSNTLREEIKHFTNCVSHNILSRPYSNDSDGMLGAHVVTCLEAARESLAKERTVRIQLPIPKEVPLHQ
jgi:predicted dehydrogenase